MELLTSSEAGAILNCSARTVQRLVDSEKLAYVRKLDGPNGAYLFARSDVEALAAARAEATA